MKKMLVGLVALAVVAASSAAYAAVKYRFTSVCTSPGICGAPNPVHFGPFATLPQCLSARAVIAAGPFGQAPGRSLSSCYTY